jgi:lipoprotein-releasing system permease protein
LPQPEHSVTTQRGFEWFVAWRHLRDPERRSRHAIALKVGLTILALSVGLFVYLKVHGIPMRDPNAFFTARPDPFYEWLSIGSVIGIIVGFIISLLGALLASLTLFTAFSVFGVFLGTAAPILALSVMSGFEADLKGKIRGTKADVVVTVPDDRPFLDWPKVRESILRVPGVLAATPYIEAEVMVRSGASPAGIVLRGVRRQASCSAWWSCGFSTGCSGRRPPVGTPAQTTRSPMAGRCTLPGSADGWK